MTYKGKTYTGYMSLCAAVDRTLDQGIPLTSPSFYGQIDEESLNKFLMADDDVPCPLIKERLQCLHGE